MAAAEARAAWQRAANRCLVQEDAKRAPKLACCPSSMQQHDANNGNSTNPEDFAIPSFMPLNWNPMNSNLPTDTQWWLQLQPNFGCQKDFISDQMNFMGGEIGEKRVECLAPMSKLEPLYCETVNISPKKSEDLCEPPWIVSTAFMKHSSETGFEEFKTLAGYSQVPLKCKGNYNNCLYENKEFKEFKTFDPLFPKKPQKACCEMDAPWEESKKSQPWWQVADVNGLASLVAERAMQKIDNCNMPRPTQTVHVHGTKLHNHENMNDYGWSPHAAGKESYPGLYDPMQCSYSTSSTGESNGGGPTQHQRSNSHGGAQDSYSSSDHTPERKPTYQNASERAQLLDALRHSQTRAREAEMAVKKAYDEKDHVIKLLFRQASHLFACKQWLKMLQLENICLQLRYKEHQIATMFPEFPWMVLKEKAAPDQEQRNGKRRGRRQYKEGGFCNTIMIAIGVGLAGAGLLLGWTLGWLLPL